MKVFIRVLSVFLVLLILISMQGIEFNAASGISDFWVDASGASPKSYSGRKLTTDMVRWWYNEKNGTYYLMLPNSANLSKLKVYYTASAPVTIDGKNMPSGSEMAFNTGQLYRLNCGGITYQLVVMKASHIPSMFISTSSGSLSNIHANKDYREEAIMLLVDENGKVVYNDFLEHIKGRGNATWYDYPKKPYNIRLATSTDLLGMGKSKTWSLIANWVDKTHMHNKLAYDIAQEVGIEFSANTRHVDLYINNQYMGLYVLTERNDVDPNHVNITDLEELTEKANNVTDLSVYPQMGTRHFAKGTYKYYNIPKDPEDITGGYLIEFELSGRYAGEPSGFVTNRGQAIVIKSPEYASKRQVEYIRNFYQEFEDAIYSPTGYNNKGKHYTEYIDEESLARMYVLQEYCLNLDAAICSFFLYKESDKTGDGKLHAAPPWDFDNAFGLPGSRDGVNLQDPRAWWANKGRIHEDPSWTPHLLTAAYKHKSFVQRAVRIWHTEFKPVVDKITNPYSKVDTKVVKHLYYYRDLIRSSALMNNIFWYGSNNTLDQRIDNLINFMKTRASFLSEQWRTSVNSLDIEVIGPVVYKGSPVKPKVLVKDLDVVLKEGEDYILEYKNNNAPGEGSVTIDMEHFYLGKKTVNFTIADSTKAALADAIVQAQARSKNDYSTSQWSILQEKLSAAWKVFDKANASKAEIDKATEDLLLAMNAGNTDRSRLQEAINLANSKKAEDYTNISWNIMQRVLNDALEILNNPQASQEEIDQIADELMSSINALVPVAKETDKPGSTASPGSPKGTASPRDNDEGDKPGNSQPSNQGTAIVLIALGVLLIAELVVMTIFFIKKKKNV